MGTRKPGSAGLCNRLLPQSLGLVLALSNVQPTHLLDRKLLGALVASEAVEADPMMVPRLGSM